MTTITTEADYQAALVRLDSLNKLLSQDVAFPDSLVQERDDIEAAVREYGRRATPMLDWLRSERVVSFTVSEDGTQVEILEQCDQCFGVTLNRDDLAQLIREIQGVMGRMK